MTPRYAGTPDAPGDGFAPHARRVATVGEAWAGHPVRFALLTDRDRQFVAYYDADRRLTVASRGVSEKNWRVIQLPETTGWDSHSDLALAVDRDRCLHLAGNMHDSPLVYFRTMQPHDIESFQRAPAMVGADEERCTYGRFLSGPDASLVFTYRAGASGDGKELFNVYSEASQSWRRLVGEPLIDGEGKRSVYLDRFRPVTRAPGGFYHFCWVWRDSPDAATNHSPSYMRSRDLVNWERSDGRRLTLPVTFGTCEIVDSVPIHAGLFNNNVCMGFDPAGRPIVSYHKFDDEGNTQVFNTRLEHGRWRAHQASRWRYRWEFSGGGTIPMEIRIGPVLIDTKGRLIQSFDHMRYGAGHWTLGSASLGATAEKYIDRCSRQPASKPGQLPFLVLNEVDDVADDAGKRKRHVLRWKSVAANRDQPPDGLLPPSSRLKIVTVDYPSAQLAGPSRLSCGHRAPTPIEDP